MLLVFILAAPLALLSLLLGSLLSSSSSSSRPAVGVGILRRKTNASEHSWRYYSKCIFYITDVTNDIYRASHALVVDKLVGRIDRTRDDIKTLMAKIGSADAAEAASRNSTPKVLGGPIPLNPDRADYGDRLNHWTPTKYNMDRHKKRGTTSGNNSPTKAKSPVTSEFMEDEFGNIFPPSKRREVSKDAKAFWQWKHQEKVRLDKLPNIDWELRDEFRSTIEAAHPWLRLCEGHWKADQIWINNFSKWTPAKDPTEGSQQQDALKRERPVDEDQQAGPSSKRTKITTTDKECTRPRPKPKMKVKSSLYPNTYTIAKYI